MEEFTGDGLLSLSLFHVKVVWITVAGCCFFSRCSVSRGSSLAAVYGAAMEHRVQGMRAP